MLENYEPVAERIKRFYKEHPNGAIHTDIVFDDGHRVVIKATVWRDLTDTQPAGSDFAEEILSDRGVNATSRIENCATSAQGRALQAIGYLGQGDWTTKPTREEMQKVVVHNNVTTTNPTQPNVTIRGPLQGMASEKQLGYIRGACKRDGHPAPVGVDGFTKQEASAWIDAHKNGTNAGDIPNPLMARPDEEEPF